jgi:hypothetical protein
MSSNTSKPKTFDFMKQLYLSVITLLLSAPLTLASGLSGSDSTTVDNASSSAITVGAGYVSNTNSGGATLNPVTFKRNGKIAQAIAKKIANNNVITVEPSYSLNAGYSGWKGLSISTAATSIANSDSTNSKSTSEIDFGASYQWTVLEYFTITPSYAHYFYSKNSLSSGTGLYDFAQLQIGGGYHWLSASVSSGYTFGQSFDMNIDGGISGSFTFDNVLWKNNSLTIGPSVSFGISNQSFSNSAFQKVFGFVEAFSQRNPTVTAGDLITEYSSAKPKYPVMVARLKRNPALLRRLNKLDKNQVLSDIFVTTSTFGLSTVDLSLPICYTVKNLAFSFCVTFNQPENQPSYISSDITSYYNFGITYTFGL